MVNDLRELWKYRELLAMLVQRDLKVRYKNSVLGFGWSLLNPLLQVGIITVIFKFVWTGAPKNYSAYVFCAMLPWLFFSVGVADSAQCLMKYRDLLRKTSFPRELIPLATVIANLIHFGLSTAVFLIYMGGGSVLFWLLHHTWDFAIQPTVVLLPIPILGMALLVTGVSFFVSVWALYFWDVVYIQDSLLKLLYWAVPLLYFPEMIRAKLSGAEGKLAYALYMLNPLASFITAFRKLTLAPAVLPGSNVPVSSMNAEEWGYVAAGLAVSALVAFAGQRYFNSRKWKLAERA